MLPSKGHGMNTACSGRLTGQVKGGDPHGRERNEWDCRSPGGCCHGKSSGRGTKEEKGCVQSNHRRSLQQAPEKCLNTGQWSHLPNVALKGFILVYPCSCPWRRSPVCVPYLGVHFSKLGFDKRTAAAFSLSVTSSSKSCSEFMMEMYPYIGIYPAALDKGK